MNKRGEIKWSLEHGSFIMEELNDEDRHCLYDSVVGLLSPSEAKYIMVATVNNLQYSFTRNKLKLIEILLERVQMFLQGQRKVRKEPVYALIIGDWETNRKLETQIAMKCRESRREGTGYIVTDLVIMNLIFTSSWLNPGIQTADVVTGITTAMVARKNKYAGPYWEKVIGSFHRSDEGVINGYGLVLFPEWLKARYDILKGYESVRPGLFDS